MAAASPITGVGVAKHDPVTHSATQSSSLPGTLVMFARKLDYHIVLPDDRRNAWIDALRASELTILSEEALRPPHPGPYPDFNPRGITFSNGETSTWLTIAWSPYHRNYAVSGVIRRRSPEARAALAAIAALQSIGGEIDDDRLALLRAVAAKDAPHRRDDS